MHLGTILCQQKPCRDDSVGPVKPDGAPARAVPIRGFRASAKRVLERETASLDDISWFERIPAEAPAFEQLNRHGALQGPANRFAVFRLLFYDDCGVGIGPHITYDG